MKLKNYPLSAWLLAIAATVGWPAISRALALGTPPPMVTGEAAETESATELPMPAENGEEQLASIERQKSEVEARLAALRKQFDRTRQRVNAAGTSTVAGLELRKQRADLVDTALVAGHGQQRQEQIRAARLQLIMLRDQRDDLPVTATPAQRQAIDANIQQTDRYFELLVELDDAERQYLDMADEFRNYIDERILWIRSLPPIGMPDAAGRSEWTRLETSINRLARPDAWTATGEALLQDASDSPFQVGALLLLLLLIWFYRPSFRRQLESLNRAEAATAGSSLRRTILAICCSVLYVLPLPALLILPGWRLANFASFEFARGVGIALVAGGKAWLLLSLVSFACHPRGVGPVHFRWQPEVAQTLRWLALSLMLPVTLLTIVVALMEGISPARGESALGRIAFLLLQLPILWQAMRLFRQNSPVLAKLAAEKPRSGLVRYRRVWQALVIGVPLLLLVCAAAGYYYTALQLSARVSSTLWLLLGIFTLVALGLHWITAARVWLTQAAYSPILSRIRPYSAPVRAITQHAGEQQAAGRDEDGEIIASESQQLTTSDLAAITAQSRQLIYTLGAVLLFFGLWMIWADVLPALGALRSVELWTTTIPPAAGVADAKATVSAITLADVATAIFVLIAAMLAAKNVPGILQMSLRHMPLDNSARYAITTLSRYLLIIVGMMIAAGTIGIGWTQLQWLAAAITVGLGFGLQEIFANFVSGIIIFLERPVRIGDYVTLGNVDGTVTKIRMRATIIIDADRRELLVPNKELITGRVLNWTLSGTVTRIVIPLTIPNGADAELARKLLLEAAQQHSTVMKDPAPTAVIRGFADNGMRLELRLFVPTRDNLSRLTTELNSQIYDAFRKSNIAYNAGKQELFIRAFDPELRVAINRDKVKENE